MSDLAFSIQDEKRTDFFPLRTPVVENSRRSRGKHLLPRAAGAPSAATGATDPRQSAGAGNPGIPLTAGAGSFGARLHQSFQSGDPSSQINPEIVDLFLKINPEIADLGSEVAELLLVINPEAADLGSNVIPQVADLLLEADHLKNQKNREPQNRHPGPHGILPPRDRSRRSFASHGASVGGHRRLGNRASGGTLGG